ncbi:threonine/serine exporter family protein [Arcobacter porcinus]|uniref:threonine/serine ThrE exporter family protein n=1 Tax=Arcobacter porcinus TaxID=1935204 RepID=UPI000824830B|nr:threonine/serine exporter family protein [Arcobacter porcinus]OCL83201.1 Inner membrane protein YjjP [Arcobacter porcinus]OCL88082.1 Inner membrane protein YjjP [Arcobacter porcinus]
MNSLSHKEQSTITRGIIKAAVLMSEYGAESILIEQTAQRLGKVLGASSVEISLIPSAIVLTTLYHGQSVTTTRRVHHKPINMRIVCAIQNIVLKMEKKESEVNYDIDYLYTILKQLEANYYNRWLVIFMVGLSCMSFTFLQGGDSMALLTTFFASSIAMFVRQELSKKRFVMIIVFGITAFVATLIAGLSKMYGLSSTPNIAMAASVLLLAPGFAFVNSFLDSFKGYMMMGWGRWMDGMILTLATSVGIIIAIALLS